MKGEGEEERGRKRGRHSLRSLRRNEESGLLFFPSFARSLLAVLCIWTRAPPSHPDLLPRHLFLSLPPSDPSAGFAERARSTCFASSYCFLYDKWPRGPLAESRRIRLVSGPRWLDRSRGRRYETHVERGGIFGVTKEKLERTG